MIGRWSDDEHNKFVQAMEDHPFQWKKIQNIVKTRTIIQCRTHAQKVWNKKRKLDQEFDKLSKRPCNKFAGYDNETIEISYILLSFSIAIRDYDVIESTNITYLII